MQFMPASVDTVWSMVEVWLEYSWSIAGAYIEVERVAPAWHFVCRSKIRSVALVWLTTSQ